MRMSAPVVALPLVPLLLVAGLLLAACGAVVATPTIALLPEPTATNTAPVSQATATTPPATPTNAPAPTTTPASTAVANETLSLASRDQGLAKLQSYHVHWQAQWSSTNSSPASKETWDWAEDYSAKPMALRWTWQTTDATGKSSMQMVVYQISGTIYLITYDSSGLAHCSSFSSSDQNVQLSKNLFSPSLLGSLSGARYVSTETVAGLLTKHYTYDQTDLALPGFNKASGETWVAVDGSYVVKDVLNWQGSAGIFNAGAQGTGDGSWTWELSSVNQPLAIAAPSNCDDPTATLPMLADARNKVSTPGMITYDTASQMADIVAFYQAEMAKAGWKLSGPPMTFAGVSTLTFSKDGQTATVTIASDSARSSVMLMAGQ